MLPIWLELLNADPVIVEMQSELDAAMEVLGEREEAPHYAMLTLTDVQSVVVTGRAGALVSSDEDHDRWLDVDLRVGSPQLDSSHPLRGFSSLEDDSRAMVRVPLDIGYGMHHAVVREIDDRYRQAAEHMVVLRSNQTVLVGEEESADDFEVRDPTRFYAPPPELDIDRAVWGARLKALTAPLAEHPAIHHHTLHLSANRTEVHAVDTSGSAIVHGRRHVRLSLTLSTTAEDGDEMDVFEAFDLEDPERLPDDAELATWIDGQVQRLEALREAPRGEPYSGPVILEGRAAGVFFHEVMGHRVEGHRQKREDEGQTFADHIGQRILPPFIDVVDDPRIETLDGIDLNGHYDIDDEGTPADAAVLVDDGIFEGFLMGRSPLRSDPHSNGHGRRSIGRSPVSRMGNTMVRASESVSREQLRRMLLDRVRKQGLPYGYLVEDIAGGFALTGRTMPNAFNIRAVASWRVFADGRPDELVRGIDLVGTPFVAFSNLVAADDRVEVFNGTCGAESGWVPVSATSPGLLFERLEFQLKEKAQQRPPLLPKPGAVDGRQL